VFLCGDVKPQRFAHARGGIVGLVIVILVGQKVGFFGCGIVIQLSLDEAFDGLSSLDSLLTL
jgi:hypothetical protein